MKNRIVYPQLWLDEKFAQCKLPTKLLFMYLVTNPLLTLSRYTHLSDRQILFDTGLTAKQLDEGKQELQNLKWVFFTDNWIFHNHQCAYVDYTGRDRVLEAKESELAGVPDNVKSLFKGLVTGYKPVLNKKLETRNPKPNGGVGENKYDTVDSLTDDHCRNLALHYKVYANDVFDLREEVKLYCASTGKRYKNYSAVLQTWLRRRIKEGAYASRQAN